MRVRVVQLFCEAKCRDVYVVQKWVTRAKSHPADHVIEDHWEAVRDFELDQYCETCDLACHLSLTKKPITEKIMFEDGALAENCTPSPVSAESAQSARS
jgi:hypothetical protein